MRFLLLFLCVVAPVWCVKLPPNFLKCNRSQPNLKECVFKAAQHGISQMYKPYKKVRFPSVEPLEILEMSSSINSNLIKLNEHLKDCKFFGVSRVNLTNFDFDLTERVIFAVGVFPKVEASCGYKLNGSVFTIPIYGEGVSKLDFTNFSMSLRLTYDEVTKNSKTYAKITSSKVDGMADNIHVEIGNLFNGDEDSGRRINQLINDNWRELYDDIKDEHLEMPAQMFATLTAGFFSRVSLEEMFD
ncbi:hypothetical protein Zmor_017184 [Zophobas morio]|uniref:Uncharacterized protein n=1 Tax=Zophobas morio TaxID=2755281 RepID=A0AA38MCH8_9CUCU|nr:hypothetical protein Zmor_017184 [Zophobas morio]